MGGFLERNVTCVGREAKTCVTLPRHPKKLVQRLFDLSRCTVGNNALRHRQFGIEWLSAQVQDRRVRDAE